MDPLAIAAASFSIAGGITKAIIAVVEFSLEFKDAVEDLEAINRELHALTSILDPLTRSLSGAPKGKVPAAVGQQLGSSLDGCSLVVSQIEDTVRKYQGDRVWTRTKWVIFGQRDMEKLRKSLEAYKMALSLGIHVISMCVGDSIKEDTGQLRSETQILQLNTEEILARVKSIRHNHRNNTGVRIEEWMENITILSSYAETTYQETVFDKTVIDETVMGPGEASEMMPHLVNDDKDFGHGSFGGVTTSHPKGNSPGRRGPVFDPLEAREIASNSDEVESVPVDEEDPVYKPLVTLEERHSFGRRSPWEEKVGSLTASDWTPTLPYRPSKAGSSVTSTSTSQAQSNAARSSQGVPDTKISAIIRSETPQQQPVAETRSPASAPLVADELDVLVAIDIGRTSAAVAWMTEDIPMQVIRHWPGGEGTRVPTTVVHDRDRGLLFWGLQCAQNTGPRTIRRECPWIGDLCNPNNLPTRAIPGRLRLIYFLEQLYSHIGETISSTLSLTPQKWVELGVEFHFILPDIVRHTPSRYHTVVTELKATVREAGIGTGGPRHCSVLSLAETEAAATAVLDRAIDKKSRMLMINLGTTHATILLSDRSGVGPVLDPAYQGMCRYSMELIPIPRFDGIFCEHVRARLNEYPEVEIRLGDGGVASRARDPGILHITGVLHELHELSEFYWLPLEGFPKWFRHEPSRIADGMMGFTREEIQLILDQLVQRIGGTIQDYFQKPSNLSQISGRGNLGRFYQRYKASFQFTAQSAVMVEAGDTPGYFTRRVQISSQHASKTIRRLPTGLRSKDLAAIEGLFIHRNAWGSAQARAVCLGAPDIIRVQIQEDPVLRVDGPLFFTKTLFPYLPVSTAWTIHTDRKQDLIKLHFDISCTLDANYEDAEPSPTKLCTVSFLVGWNRFQAPMRKRRHRPRSSELRNWSSNGGYVRFVLLLFVTEPLRAGPQFKLHFQDSQFGADLYAYPASVTWYCEPPHHVWRRE